MLLVTWLVLGTWYWWTTKLHWLEALRHVALILPIEADRTLTGLLPRQRALMWEFIHELAAAGTTVVYVKLNDFDCDPLLVNAVCDAMRKGLNQYPPMAGLPELREAVAAHYAETQGLDLDPATEVGPLAFRSHYDRVTGMVDGRP